MTGRGRVDLDRLAADVEATLLALPRAKRTGDEVVYSCPLGDRHANADTHPSASYSTAKRAWRCKGCGASGGLLRGNDPLAELLGIDVDAYRTSANVRNLRRPPDRTWEIRDPAGNLVALHQRWDEPDASKRVAWASPDGSPGLGGKKVADLPLYGIDRLGEREPGDDAPVIVCEGEPATDAVLALGLRAVGTVTGASSTPHPTALEPLRGGDVVLWPDADDVGHTHMMQVSAKLQGIANSVRIFAPENVNEGNDAVDWLRANPGADLLAAIEEHARPALPLPRPTFEALPEGEGYRLQVPALAAVLEVGHVRRDRGQLRAEVLTRCAMPGAATFDGVLSVAELNLSAARSRREHAQHLAERARGEAETATLWADAVEELAHRVLAAEREGTPDVDLREVRVEEVRVLDVEGLRLPARHPAILFGDGDTGKSMVVLYVLGILAKRGVRVGMCDWECDAVDHAERLRRFFPPSPPEVRHLRCVRPIGLEGDRIRRWVRSQGLDFVAFDSVAFASAGAPESAEVAMQYFQVVRSLGPIGTLHVAHVTKSEGADRRPFGSTFWHNSPRATWFAKLADRDPGGTVSRIGLYPRKWNLGPLPSPVGLELSFGSRETMVRGIELAAEPDLAATLSVRQRMIAALRTGPMSREELAEEVDADANTIARTARRYKDHFYVSGKVISLAERRP